MLSQSFNVSTLLDPKRHTPKTLMVVGDSTMVLSQTYDHNQLWFEFMAGSLFSPNPEPAAPPEHRPITAKRVNRLYAPCPESAKKMYHHQPHQYAYCLPFHEHRRVTNAEWAALDRIDHIGWARANGYLLGIHFHPKHNKEVTEWARTSARGRYHVCKSNAFFEVENDFIIAKIVFDDGDTVFSRQVTDPGSSPTPARRVIVKTDSVDNAEVWTVNDACVEMEMLYLNTLDNCVAWASSKGYQIVTGRPI